MWHNWRELMNNKVPNIKELRKIGKSWFVSYIYFETIDKNERSWQKCSSVELRKNIYNKNREFHTEWLKSIIYSSENKLANNKLSISGLDIKFMACIVYKKIMNITD